MIRPSIPILALLALPLAAQAPSFPPQGPGSEGMRHGPGEPDHRGPGGLQPPGPEQALRALGLTPDQDRAVKAILDKGREADRPIHKALMDKEGALQAAVQDPAAPEAHLRALHAAASETRFQLLLARRGRLQEIHALLTPDQKARLKRLQDKMAREREARRALMEEMPPPPPLRQGD